MKAIKCFIVLSCIFFPLLTLAQEEGKVCLGPFLSKVWYEPSTRPYLTIGKHGPFRFEQGSQSSQLIKGLNLKETYKVKVHFKGEVVSSWNINFDKAGSNTVRIWRSAGAWRMEPVKDGACE